MSGMDLFGDPLPQTTLDSIRRTRLALKRPLTTTVGGGYHSNVRLCKEFISMPTCGLGRTLIQGGRYEAIDLVLVRENTGALRRL